MTESGATPAAHAANEHAERTGRNKSLRRVCDSHMHFYDHTYAVAPAAVLRPPDASPADYRNLQQELGLGRVVVVQPTTYGLDNSCQLAAMASFGDAARGVMVVDHGTPAAELVRLSELGVRGARFHMLSGGAVQWESLLDVARNIAPFGWHIQLQLNGRELTDHIDLLHHLPCRLVVDHVGRFTPPVPEDDSNFKALLALVEDGAMVKLSAPYESSSSGPPNYPDVVPLIDALTKRAPDRLLWATNWPHPGQADPPTAAELLRLRDRWLPTHKLRQQVLVTNPAELYDF